MPRIQLPWAKLTKLIGVAGVVGVAATGVLIARGERQRRAYTPDEIRARLHARLGEANDMPEPDDTPESDHGH